MFCALLALQMRSYDLKSPRLSVGNQYTKRTGIQPELESLLCRNTESMDGEVETPKRDGAARLAMGTSVDEDVLHLQKMLELLLRIEEYDTSLSNELEQEGEASHDIRINKTQEASVCVSKALVVEETRRDSISNLEEGASSLHFSASFRPL